MVPPPEALPDVLPTDRLTATGMPVPALREELRRIPVARNVGNVVSVWVQSAGLLALACWVTVRVPLPAAMAVWALTFVLMGRAFGRWWLWPVMWLAPWMTVWRVLNRLRAVAEHGGMGVPFQHLPALHDELVASGWVTPEATFPNYWVLWKTASSG